VARLAGGFQSSGLMAGDRVVLVLPNGPDLLEALWASFWAGIVAVPLNRHLHAREVAYVVQHSAASAVVLSDATREARHQLPTGTKVLLTGSPEYAELTTAGASAIADIAPDSPAWLFYTSGTTGRPKGATLTHRNLLAMIMSFYADIDALADETIFLHAAPLTHGSGLYMLPAIAHGATNVIAEQESFDPAQYLGLVDQHGVTHAAFLAPTMLRRLTDVAAKTGWGSSTLRNIVIGGAALYEEDLADAIQVFGPVIWQMYGQGEAPMTIAVMSPALLTTRDGPESNWRSCGRPFTGVEVLIGEPERPALPAHEPGEILVRGDVVMAGYWSDPGATFDALGSGWLRTGDVGYFDDSGFLYLTDRSKDVIITGGSNVYPREVEEVLLSHPAVHEVAVVGVPDPEWGESVRAYVVAVHGSTPCESDLIDHCRQQLASFKKPRSVVFVDDLPKSSNGKILKRALRTEAGDDR
jgi:acyl-CoA synthetase (AMP-forming)/AMP-acid ligase II